MVPRLEISRCIRARNLRRVGPFSVRWRAVAASGWVVFRKVRSWMRSMQYSRL